MEKIKNLSLKGTIILYMTISLLSSFLLSAVIVQIATKTQQQIWWKYIDEEKYFEAVQKEGEYNRASIPRVSRMDMNRMDGDISELCDFLETYTVLFLSIAGSCIAVAMFYRNKLKVPIEELGKASERIAHSELDFCITYQNGDEMGRLCQEFEKMRRQLEENNRTVWHMVEEEKALRAAIAHDIRSPLSILQGYQEMLLEFVPEEAFDKNRMIEMLLEGMKQIERLNGFIETMRRMSSLTERELQLRDIDLQTLGKEIQSEAWMMSKDTGKVCAVRVQESEEVLHMDLAVILEVTENLLSNALRYAKKEIQIFVSVKGRNVEITVIDDGSGFTEDSETVTKAFYHSNPQDNLLHFGMGMYISRIYCEKHGGRLLIGNQKQGGAVVKAIFQSKE